MVTLKKLAKPAIIAAILLLTGLPGHSGQLKVIELGYRPAAEIMPIIKPLLQPGDTLTGHGYLLFVTTSTENLSRIESIVRRIDQAPRQLMITVVQGENAREMISAFDVSGNIHIGDDISIRVGKDAIQPRDSITFRTDGSRTRSDSRNVQRVRVNEGTAAAITVGMSIPVITAIGRRPRRGGPGGEAVEYRDILTGFEVTPRISGDRVVIDISSRREGLSNAVHGAVAIQHIDTQVQGRIDEWIEIGTILQSVYRLNDGLTSRKNETGDRKQDVFIKVTHIR